MIKYYVTPSQRLLESSEIVHSMKLTKNNVLHYDEFIPLTPTVAIWAQMCQIELSRHLSGTLRQSPRICQKLQMTA